MRSAAFQWGWDRIFQELLKSLKGKALRMVKPLAYEPSYQNYASALQQLQARSLPKEGPVAHHTKRFIEMCHTPVKTHAQREDVLSMLREYQNALESHRVPEWARWWTLVRLLFEPIMDVVWRKAWAKERQAHYNPNSSLIYLDSFNIMINCLEKAQRHELITYDKNRGGEKQARTHALVQRQHAPKIGTWEATSNAVAGTPYADKQKKRADKAKGKGQTAQKPMPCPFCSHPQTGKQEFTHRYPRSCPRLKKGHAKQLAANEVRNIVEKKKLCRLCFGPHFVTRCDAPANIKCGVEGCGRRHHDFFHAPSAEGRSRPVNQVNGNVCHTADGAFINI